MYDVANTCRRCECLCTKNGWPTSLKKRNRRGRVLRSATRTAETATTKIDEAIEIQPDSFEGYVPSQHVVQSQPICRTSSVFEPTSLPCHFVTLDKARLMDDIDDETFGNAPIANLAPRFAFFHGKTRRRETENLKRYASGQGIATRTLCHSERIQSKRRPDGEIRGRAVEMM